MTKGTPSRPTCQEPTPPALSTLPPEAQASLTTCPATCGSPYSYVGSWHPLSHPHLRGARLRPHQGSRISSPTWAGCTGRPLCWSLQLVLDPHEPPAQGLHWAEVSTCQGMR